MMELEDIKKEAWDMVRNGSDAEIRQLGCLVSNLAARMKEVEEAVVKNTISRVLSEGQDQPCGFTFIGKCEKLAHAREECECYETPLYETVEDHKNELKTHFVTVQYRATENMNKQIEDLIKCTLCDVDLDYARITSDKE